MVPDNFLAEGKIRDFFSYRPPVVPIWFSFIKHVLDLKHFYRN